MHNFSGEIAALSAAFLWAASSAVYGIIGQKIPPLQLNFLKGIIAIALIVITLILREEITVTLQRSVGFLFLSGAIGIGLGDTAYFAALKSMGARKTLLIQTLAPPSAALLALIFLSEKLSYAAWCGIALVLFGVAWVISERTPQMIGDGAGLKKGLVWGIIAALTEAIGAILSRLALVESDITPLWSALLRLIAGTTIALFLLLIKSMLQQPTSLVSSVAPAPSLSMRQIGAIGVTAFGSTYLGIWLQQTALKFVSAGIAQTLSAVSPLFILPIAAAMGDKISIRTILGVLVALVGIGVLFSLK